MSMERRGNVAVFFGGTSAEAEVSVVSGSAIADALRGEGFDVAELLVARDGTIGRLPADHRRGDRAASDYLGPRAFDARGARALPLAQLLNELARDQTTSFLALHGPGDEDGPIQVALQERDLAFVGADHAAARLGMEKPRFKALVLSLGLPTLPSLTISREEWGAAGSTTRATVLERLAAFAAAEAEGRALIGKPAAHGSSIGMRIGRTPQEWSAAVALALEYGEVALIEPYLEHPRELEVALLERLDGRVDAFGPGEVFPGREFYDYEAKYAPGVSRTTTAPDLDPAIVLALQEASVQLFRASGCRGLARIDFLLPVSGAHAGAWQVSEINTLPGFTPISLYPALLIASGMTFGDLCRELVEVARARPAGRGA